MATIRLRGRKYRAEVVRLGHRRSATFATVQEASVWAKNQEAEILGFHPDDLDRPLPQPHEVESAEMAESGLIKDGGEILSRPRFKPACGVYFLICGEEIVYVGKSLDIHARVARHFRLWKEFDSYTYISCRHDQLDSLERHYIKTLAPRLNRSGL